MKTHHYPFVDVKNKRGLCGLLYTNRDGSRDLFNGNYWIRLDSTDIVEIGIFKEGCIEKYAEYVKHVQDSDDRYFSSPAGKID